MRLAGRPGGLGASELQKPGAARTGESHYACVLCPGLESVPGGMGGGWSVGIS